MRASRLLSVLMLLQARGRMSALALARAFEVSPRTIHRDIDELSAAGIPITSTRGPQGGFALSAGYQTRLTGLATDEENALAVMTATGPARSLGLESAAKSASLKLFAALPQGGARAAGFAAKVHFDLAPWYHEEASLPELPAIVRAVLEQRVLVARYESWKATRIWRINPLGLVLKAGSWYLVGETAKGITTFSAAKLSHIEVTDASFEWPRSFDLATHWRSQLDAFEQRLRPTMARLRVGTEAVPRLLELGQFATNAVQNAKPSPSKKTKVLTLDLPIESIAHAARQLMGLGAAFEVIAPDALRDEVRRLASQALRLNLETAVGWVHICDQNLCRLGARTRKPPCCKDERQHIRRFWARR